MQKYFEAFLHLFKTDKRFFWCFIFALIITFYVSFSTLSPESKERHELTPPLPGKVGVPDSQPKGIPVIKPGISLDQIKEDNSK
jgi:hypothetical protein